ncbi:MAG: selenocysteine-specific translation elongation factor [Syntrophomonadaceae bacterium]|nr:selenocysteine-specific translation elongation factor [Syntrophomonadaceae bacterium]
MVLQQPAKHFIIGTAGHVDHGKTQLVKRLTGIDTDRLKEEKERGISIELGFAPLRLPSGKLAGIVDVPGHERFVKHMLAGASGIDLVLLVVAADEGVMPQTREHLDILKLLGTRQGVIVITKKDLVDEDLLELVKEEVREAVAGSFLENAPLAVVSSHTGEGIAELTALLDRQSAGVEEKEAAGKARLPIDRVFSITGFGTVVTGTLFSGKLSVGDPVEILPEGLSTRVRNLQVHGRRVEEARAGQRLAVNLAGLAVSDLSRGSVLAAPGYLAPSFRLDVNLELLPHARRPLKNLSRVRFHLGTKEALGRVLLLEAEELAPGGRAYAQMVMEEPVVAARRDRFVIRAYSPMITIGGGTVIDPSPPKRKRFKEETIADLATREKGQPDEILLQYLYRNPPYLWRQDEMEGRAGLDPGDLDAALKSLQRDGRVVQLNLEGQVYLVHPDRYLGWQEELEEALRRFHQEHPLRSGLSKEETRSRYFRQLPVKVFSSLLQVWEQNRIITVSGQNVSRYGFVPRPTEEQERVIQGLIDEYRAAGVQPPDWSEAADRKGLGEKEREEILNYLLAQKQLVKVTDELYFAASSLELARQKIADYFKENESLTVADARGLLGGSRKFILPLLEHFDREKLTRRVGDQRKRY